MDLKACRCTTNNGVTMVLAGSSYTFAIVEHIDKGRVAWCHLFVKDSAIASRVKAEIKAAIEALPDDLASHIRAGKFRCFLLINIDAPGIVVALQTALKVKIEYIR